MNSRRTGGPCTWLGSTALHWHAELRTLKARTWQIFDEGMPARGQAPGGRRQSLSPSVASRRGGLYRDWFGFVLLRRERSPDAPFLILFACLSGSVLLSPSLNHPSSCPLELVPVQRHPNFTPLPRPTRSQRLGPARGQAIS